MSAHMWPLTSTSLQVEPHQLTFNRSPSDWYGLFPNPVVAEGLLDRLVNSAHHVLMEGKSYRPNKRPGRPDRTEVVGEEQTVM